LKTTLVNLKEEEQKQIGGDAENKYFLPSKAPKDSGTQKLLHMTYVFQIFVFMQIFNQCNARLLTGSFNIFEGMSRNWLFIAVALSTFVIQMTMVEVGGKITKTYPLELWRNGICLIFGSGELIWGVLIKFLPITWFQCFNFEETPMTDDQYEKSTLGRMKNGSSIHKKA
jgi:magnesium-transporting ATPase (P-type)